MVYLFPYKGVPISLQILIKGVSISLIKSVPISLNGVPISLNGVPISLNGVPISLNGVPISLNGVPISLNGVPISLKLPFYQLRKNLFI